LVLLELTEQLGQIIVVGVSLQSHIYAFERFSFSAETVKLWVGWKLAEAELQHWAIGTGNVYLLLLLQLLENKVIINLTCSEFVEGQEVIKLSDWFLYFLISFSLQESNSLVKRPFSSH
jgi:hypothetical protein